MSEGWLEIPQSSTPCSRANGCQGKENWFSSGINLQSLVVSLKHVHTGNTNWTQYGVYIAAIIIEGVVMCSREGGGGDMRRIGVGRGRGLNEANSAFMHETLKNHKSKPEAKEPCFLRACL